MPALSGGGQLGASLVKLNRSGKLQWTKQFTASTQPTFFYRILETTDKHIIALGYLGKSSGANTIVIKMTPNGQPIWQKEIVIPGSGEQFGLMLTQTNDGHIVITSNVNNQNPGIVQAQLLKVNISNGSLIWERQFQFNGSAEARSLIADGASLVVVGVVNGPSQTMNDGFVMKLDHSNGNIQWMKMIESEGRMNRLLDIKKNGNQYLLAMQNGIAGDNDVKPAILTLDINGSLLSAQQFDFSSKSKNNYPGRWLALCQNGDIIQAYGENIGPSLSRPVIARFSSSGNLIWANEYRALNNLYINRLSEDINGHIAVVGTASESSALPRQFLVIKTDANGTIANQDAGGCTPQAVNVSVSTSPVTFYNASWLSTSSAGVQSVDANLVEVSVALPPPSQCSQPISCTGLTLSGPQAFCTSQGDLEILATLNAGCNQALAWSFDPIQADLISSSNTKLVLRPKIMGSSNLRIDASLSGCNAIRSTWTVAVTKNAPLQFSLGKDSTICSGSYTLKGPDGMTQYAWSNGSTQQYIQVNSAGNYWLRVTDGCAQTGSDTISLAFAPSAQFTLGPDSSICGTTSLTLQGPQNMQTYRWSNGNTTSNSTITSPGIYWLETTDACLQTYRDSIIIGQALAAKPFSLGNDISSCRDTSMQLVAPAGMAAYQWSNGNTSPVISVTQPGIYWVRITDACHGKASDTIRITSLPVPVVLLGSDTSLCGNLPLRLDAGNPGSQYTWSTGETTQSISATISGTYSVTVTNTYGCTGSDKVQVNFGVAGNLEGYQMPSAFTPNKDGLNDCFGLKKWGSVNLIRFDVFNRWGEKVFTGKSASDCWEGTWQGNPQPSGHFPYIVVADTPCGRVTRQGLVALIR